MTTHEIRMKLLQVIDALWSRGHANATGVSVSCRLDDQTFIVDKAGTGFRRAKISVEDFLVLDLKLSLIERFDSENQLACPSTIVHSNFYKSNSLARACIHCHAPNSLVFACLGKSIPPITIQAEALGEIPCVLVDAKALEGQYRESEQSISIPSGITPRGQQLYAMSQVADGVVKALSGRMDELNKHGLACTHYKHGIFVFAKNIDEAFENLERIEINARTMLFAQGLK